MEDNDSIFEIEPEGTSKRRALAPKGRRKGTKGI